MKRGKKTTREDKAEHAKQDGVYCPARNEHIPYGLCSKLMKRKPENCEAKGCGRIKKKGGNG